MKRKLSSLLIICCFILITLVLSGCRNFQITILFPENEHFQVIQEHPINNSSTPNIEETNQQLQQLTQTPSSNHTIEAESYDVLTNTPGPNPDYQFDPDTVFIPSSDLPAGYRFEGGDLMTFFVSYLESPGNLSGLAYVRQYDCWDENLFFSQILIVSPSNFNSTHLQTGHFGRDFSEVSPEYIIGNDSLFLNAEDGMSFRFINKNIMGIINLRGTDEYVNFENIHTLASQLYANFPEENVIPRVLQQPGTTLNSDLYDSTFEKLELAACDMDNTPGNEFYSGDLGFCFLANIKDMVQDFKAGIYSEKYEQLLYLKDFHSSPKMGEWVSDILFAVWGFGWNLLPEEGTYQMRFWVDDELVAILPFHYSQ